MNTVSDEVVESLLRGQSAFVEVRNTRGDVRGVVTVIPIRSSKSGRIVRLRVQSGKRAGGTAERGAVP